MQIAMGLKKVDGLWNSTDPITWSDPTSNYKELQKGTLMTMNVPNVNNTNEYYYGFKYGKYDRTVYVLNEADNTWVTVGNDKPVLQTTQGMKIVTIPDTDGVKIYVAKDNTQYGMIPNISTRMRTETYVSDDINSGNFMSYRTWNHIGSVSGYDEIYLTIAGAGVSSTTYDSDNCLFAVGVQLVPNGDQNVMKLTTPYLNFGYETNPDTEWGKLPTISNHYYSANQSPDPMSGLDTRVTKLENQMADLLDRVAKLEKDIVEIPQLIAWTNEGTSKYYVSR